MSKKERNTQIPEEAIKGAAGYGAEFTFTAIDIAAYFKDSMKNKEPVPYSVVSNELKKEIISLHLKDGMSIPAAVTTENQRKALREAMSKEEQQK